MYKLTAQHTCPLHSTVNDLCEFTQNKTLVLAFVSLSEAVFYVLYPLAADHADYTIVPVNNGMTQSSG